MHDSSNMSFAFLLHDWIQSYEARPLKFNLSLLSTMRREGKWTWHGKRKEEWMNLVMTSLLARVMFESALNDGTLNWDVVVSFYKVMTFRSRVSYGSSCRRFDNF